MHATAGLYDFQPTHNKVCNFVRVGIWICEYGDQSMA